MQAASCRFCSRDFLARLDGVIEALGELLVKVRDVIDLLSADGWFLKSTRGSHRQYKHPTKPGRVTVAGKPADDIALGTLDSILKQAGLKRKR